MFTGLIQGLGTLERISSERVRIVCHPASAKAILQDLALGDSVAVDGVCLTVEEILQNGFLAAASPETLRRTTLGFSEESSYVNLETSLRVGSKLGGHFVTGHVDGTGCLQEALETASSWEVTFSVSSSHIARYIVSKGSIAVNGISLTIAECDQAGTWFKVAVIPVTWAETNLHYLKPGSFVNLEGDIIGKYVEKFLGFKPALENRSGEAKDSITEDFLAEHGFM